LELLKLKLESVSLTAPVYALSLTTGETHLRTPDTQDFFSGKKSHSTHAQLMALLQAKLGGSAVQRINLNDDFRPEEINQYQAVKGSASIKQAMTQAKRKENSGAPELLLPNRPLFFLSPPQALTEKVRLVTGPERICSGWWDDKPVLRDYFIAYSATHRWYWVYRTAEQQWYLHGVFS
jgi:protein ImuB